MGLRALLSDSMMGIIQIINDAILTRASSHHISGRDDHFRQEVRARDGGCVVTHIMNRNRVYDRWFGFEAAHIFPFAYESQFTSQGLSRWITNKRGNSNTGINSCQNGLLLRADIHQLFDNYGFSIHVDVSPTCMKSPSLENEGEVEIVLILALVRTTIGLSALSRTILASVVVNSR